jgi:catechol 2,3-dioxygenase-like lactoylglutathione lyase family enzyme
MQHFLLVLVILTIPILSRFGQDPTRPQTNAPISFHHVHLNSMDPAKAIEFYTGTFDVTRKARVAGFDAVQSENMFLLFNQVKANPVLSPDSPIWHFGWGSTAMEPDYAKHLANGVSFQTPITRLGSGLLFAYMRAPDGALVEINTSNTRAFIHVHLYSAAPLCTSDWYIKNLGGTTRATREREGSCDVPFAAPSEPLGVIRSPSATVRFGDVSLIIYPKQRPTTLVSPRGHVVDHIGLAVTDLDATLARLKSNGVKVLESAYKFGKSDNRAVLIEGPDAIAIELVEVK